MYGFAKRVKTQWGTYNISCFEKVQGKSLEDVEGTFEIARGYGNTLGKLHALLKEYPVVFKLPYIVFAS